MNFEVYMTYRFLIKSIFTGYCFFLNQLAFSSVDWSSLDKFQETMTKERFEAVFQSYIKQNDVSAHNYIDDHFVITESEVAVYGVTNGLKNEFPDYVFHFGRKEASSNSMLLPSKDLSKPLAHLKVALNPGAERQFIQVNRQQEDEGVYINYRHLTFATAWALKSMLEEAGAKVLITRPSPESRLSLSHVNQIINQFDPHLAIGIHYNLHRTCQGNGMHTLQDKNYIVSFISGCVMTGELESEQHRFEVLRDIVSSKIERSLEFSRILTKQLVEKLAVEALNPGEKPFENHACRIENGICSRNLAFTRGVGAVNVYGFPLCMDNNEEFYRLADKSVEIAGVKTSPRILDVAESYFQAIKEFYLK